MASRVAQVGSTFRKKFTTSYKTTVNWFPGHMNKGLLAMQKKLKETDCIIEVHDARIPLTGRNPNFRHRVTAIKPHLMVFTKLDLADLSYKSQVEDELRQEGITNIIYANCKDPTCRGVRKVIPTALDLMLSSDRYHRSELKEHCIMVIGIPNVGKSSLINILRSKYLKKGKATRVGAVAGITRAVQERIKVSEDPLVYLLDTPGIMMPNIRNMETGLRLALCSTLKEDMMEPELVADYLLYWLNKHQNFKYVDYMELEEPTDDIREVMVKSAISLNYKIKLKDTEGSWIIKPDLCRAALHLINGFRSGAYGNVILDDDILQSSQHRRRKR